MTIPEIEASIVTVREDQSGDKRLIAYGILQQKNAINTSSVRAYLAERLPDYMIPVAVVWLDRFPLTPNGKIDHKALPSPNFQRGMENYTPPRTLTEKVLVKIWQSVLGMPAIGIEDNFFTLGGHSLLAVKAIARIQQALQIEAPLRLLFEAPTIAGLATQIDQQLHHSQLSVIPIIERNQTLPLSFAQQRIWFLNRLEGPSETYLMTAVWRLSGSLDIFSLESSLRQLFNRHEGLRCNFRQSPAGEPFATIRDYRHWQLPVIPLSASQTSATGMNVASHYERICRPFDLENEFLVRVELIHEQAEQYCLLIVIHHIIFDGWSWDIFYRELAELYEAHRENRSPKLPPLSIQYPDFAAYQRNPQQETRLSRQLHYWQEQLAPPQATLQLPTDYPRPKNPSHQGGRVTIVFPQTLQQQLYSLKERQGCTLFTVLLAVFKILLARLSGQTDIFVGTPVASRTRMELESLLGFFINTLVLRTQVLPEKTFCQFLAQVHHTVLAAQENQDVPFEKLIEVLNPERDISRTPLFQVWFNMVNLSGESLSLTGLQTESLSLKPPSSKFDLSVYIREVETGIQVDVSYSTELYTAIRIQELLVQYQQLLMQVVEDPDKVIEKYSLVTSQSRLPDPKMALVETPFEPVTQLLTTWANRYPDNVAIRLGEQTWLYQELLEKSHQCAQALISVGIKPGDTVAVTGDRSFGLVVAMWGILFSGGVLLTLDTALPQKRRQRMLAASEANYILYARELLSGDQWLEQQLELLHINIKTGNLEVDQPQTDSWSSISLPKPQGSAYIFFTSGTTGTPKGVLGTHQGLSHFLHWQRETFSVKPGDRVAQLTGLSFDVVLREIFLPLTSGATLSLPDSSVDLSSSSIIPWLGQQQISILHIVPSLAQVWINDCPNQTSLSNMRCLFFAGEPLSDNLVHQWRHFLSSSCRIINLYGPTETTLAKCYFEIPETPPSRIQPVGTSLPGSQALVFADEQRLCGVGEAGEIVIRTPYRTTGYLNNPEENVRRFVLNSARDDKTDLLYFTVDRGRYRPDGQLEILGRLDNQIKIRGVRVELGEISSL
ncbi:MAG: amino acid adenylation domain-containing protein, partial [Cyanobacteria bacterium P01_H01_bin.15]